MKLYVTLRFDDQQHARKFQHTWHDPYVINTHHHSGKKTVSCKKKIINFIRLFMRSISHDSVEIILVGKMKLTHVA